MDSPDSLQRNLTQGCFYFSVSESQWWLCCWQIGLYMSCLGEQLSQGESSHCALAASLKGRIPSSNFLLLSVPHLQDMGLKVVGA
jgi:hypothetical protein